MHVCKGSKTLTCLESWASAVWHSFVSFIARDGADVKPRVKSKTSAMRVESGTIMATGLKRVLRLSGSSTRPA